jgi:SOS response associated peptidase (SRAP)
MTEWGPTVAEELAATCRFALTFKVGKSRRPLTDIERDMVADAIVEHIRLCNWKIERGPPWEGFSYLADGWDMCGRFTYRLTWPELVRLYRLTLDAPARNTQPRYNVCPTTPIDAVIERDGVRELLPMRWGLIPSWWSKPLKQLKAATFNACSETVAEKPMFR